MKWLYIASKRPTAPDSRGFFDECFVMGWCFDESNMTKVRGSEGSKLAKQLESLKQDVAALKTGNSGASQSRAGGFWTKPWVVSLGSAIISGLVVWLVTMSSLHLNNDSKRDISDEVSRQLGGEAVKNQIIAEVSRQLVPINQQLNSISEAIGKIKDNLHIAKAEPLPKIDEQMRALEASAHPNPAQVTKLAKSLTAANPNAPGYWPTVARLINLNARIRTGKPLSPYEVRFRPSCIHLINGSIERIRVDELGNYNCAVNLDNTALSDSTISNALVYFSGTVRLSNVRFINCVFVVALPVSPQAPAKRLAGEILASNANQTATFTVTAG